MKITIPASLTLKMCQRLEQIAVPCCARQQFNFRALSSDIKAQVCELVVENDPSHAITLDQIAQELELAYPRYCRQIRDRGIDGMIDNYRLTGQIA